MPTRKEEIHMERQFSLEYWIDDKWYVGKLKEVPGVFSQGETLDELESNIRDAYNLMVEDEPPQERPDIQRKEITVYVA
jgi:predicted RNase H-like HicB family nuclease